MPIIISQIKSSLEAQQNEIVRKALKAVGISESDVLKAEIHKTSLDARKHDDIHFVHAVYVQLNNPKTEKNICEKNGLNYVESTKLLPVISDVKHEGKVAVVGFGPAGMFAALILAENGYKPVVFERGESVDERIESVKRFWQNGDLNEKSNVQFGEGGAGTFSDGKLTTRIKDPLCRYVLERFVQFGAPEEILVKAKAHIGTDNLRTIVKAIRNRIVELGGEVRFNSKIDDLKINNGVVNAVCMKDTDERTSAVILAVGHSARDTFEMLLDNGVMIEPKPFAVGTRIEHTQDDVDKSLYGNQAGNPLLPKGEYQLSYTRQDKRAAYTFCMCPGGYVVASSSEVGGVVTNGMSEYARDGSNANSALVVSVTPRDFGTNPLDGVNFAQTIEKNAFISAGSTYKAPATTVGGFLSGKSSLLPSSINPSYSLGVCEADFRKIFPNFVCEMMQTGLDVFAKRMKCFADANAILTAPETRTSSPVKITRTENMNCVSLKNMYPCGEGAGYAGGIMSSAVDGIKAALQIMTQIAP